MVRNAEAADAAVGFRVKSGWATAVLLAGPVQTPRALDRRIVELSDPDVPESRQPYHAAMGMLEQDAAKIRRRTKVVQRVAARSVAALLDRFRTVGCPIRGAGLVVGSQVDPASIANPHIRAHALEGALFRTVLADALRAHRLSYSVVMERDIYGQAVAVLVRSEGELKRAVTTLGRALEGPWRAEEKLAALAAWMILA
jgi:hypothetical protein